jgi:hypothetical protein
MDNKFFEWAGVITAILYSLFVALNIGIEFFGFVLYGWSNGYLYGKRISLVN